jgi:hypothetical protein
VEDEIDIMELISGGIAPLPKYQPILIPQEKIDNTPFSVHAVLNKKQLKDLHWFYIDQYGKVQGGFSSMNMDMWYQ